jgi:hypothetical protein
MLDHTQHSSTDMEYTQPFYLADFMRTLRGYSRIILLTVIGVMLLYAIVAGLIFLRAPSQKLTAQPFRLDFERANRGEYPNGLKFSTAEIVSSPVTRTAFDRNQLGRFIPFHRFAEGVFVLESNAAYERLANDYAARLSDPKLNPLDRERIQNEFDSKRQSLPKNEYTINFLRRPTDDPVPESVIRKALEDILRLWAERAINDQRVLNYQVAILSPSVITQSSATQEPSIAVQRLRSQIQEVVKNVSGLSQIPGSEVVRTPDGQTLAEVKFRLQELIRYRVEPLATTIHESGVGNRQTAINFVSEQIAYDQRALGAIDEYIAGARDSLTIYSGYTGAPADTPSANGDAPASPARPLSSETVMPQISEGFIDRLFALTKTIADTEYRQKAIEDMRKAVAERIPIQQDLSYHQHVLEQLRRPPNGNGHTRETIDREIAMLYDETRKLVIAVNQLYNRANTNLSPATHLYTLTSPSLSRTERTVSFMRLVMTGIVVFLIALVMSVAFALLHARIRHEEWEQSMMRAQS